MSKNLFNTVQMKAPGKNQFDLTHDVKLSTKMGVLTPVCVFDAIPGDTFHLGSQALIRFAPLVAPVMHRFDASIHYFFVPNRIVWDGWEEWITNPASERVFPYFRSDDAPSAVGDLTDYMGMPDLTQAEDGLQYSPLAFAAYQAIYNEYYRDQNLIPEVNYKLEDGLQSFTERPEIYELRRRSWNHDYYTSCLPFAQKGTQVNIPLVNEGLLPLVYNELSTNASSDITANNDGPFAVQNLNTTDFPTSGLAVNVQAQANSITDLRRAFKLQEWLEIQARGGTRYTEQIRAQFNVVSSDARLQRPEYITGVKQPVVISEVLNTTGTEQLPQANMAGHGVAAIRGRYGKYFCEEHGYIIGIMSIMPHTAYQQGVPKHFLKTRDQFEYYWPSFAHIGEQAVEKQEVYALAAIPNETFGYIPRYAEYKFVQNRVAGQFKTTLNTWHAGRIFETEPQLNQEFIDCNPTTRIFAVTDPEQDNMFCQVLNQVHAIRPMPKYGNPYM